MNRRHFLRTTGICLGLPALESYASESRIPQRFIGINNTLGLHLPFFVPKVTGPHYEASRYLQILSPHRSRMSVFSGLMHTDVDGGHAAEKSFLSGAPHPGAASFHNTVSIDQLIADHHAGQTRLPHLNLRTTSDAGLGQSCNARGQVLPATENPKAIFAKMCFAGSADDTQKVIVSLAHDHSVLDHVLDEAARVQKRGTAADRERLDEYFTALRDVEKDLQREQIWAANPKPKDSYTFPDRDPGSGDIVARANLLMDMSALAFRIDATRSIALKLFGTGATPIVKGVTESYHGLSHHGQDENKVEQLALIEEAIMHSFARFLDQLTSAKLLDHTTVLFGSSMSNASSHNNSNLPIIVAGGGLKHGAHHRFDAAQQKRPPLANLYLDLLHHHGVAKETFASSTGTLSLL